MNLDKSTQRDHHLGGAHVLNHGPFYQGTKADLRIGDSRSGFESGNHQLVSFETALQTRHQARYYCEWGDYYDSSMALPKTIPALFLKMLSGNVGLSQEEIPGFLTYWDAKVLKKKTHLLSPGDISRETAYVGRGCFRRYLVSENNKESILNFATEDWWVGDLESFFLQQPTRYYVQALEDSEVLTLSRQNYLRVIEIFPKYKSFHEEKIQRTLFATLNRATAAKVESPEEKYLKLAKEQPNLFQRIPLHHIATYLGIEPESLSRLRKRLTHKA